MSLSSNVNDLAGRVASEFNTVRSELDAATEISRVTVKNTTGSTLSKGSAVYISGATGDNMLVSLAQANGEMTSSKTLGLLAQDLLNDGVGYVITEGMLYGVNTSAATVGDPVWLSPTVPGGLLFGAANKPSAPNHMVYMGVVTRVHATVGEIFIHVQNGYELDELHDVAITSPTTGQVLQWDGSKWINDSIPSDPLLSGATGNIQDQLDSKIEANSPTITNPTINLSYVASSSSTVSLYYTTVSAGYPMIWYTQSAYPELYARPVGSKVVFSNIPELSAYTYTIIASQYQFEGNASITLQPADGSAISIINNWASVDKAGTSVDFIYYDATETNVSISPSELGAINDAASNVQNQLDSKASASTVNAIQAQIDSMPIVHPFFTL